MSNITLSANAGGSGIFTIASPSSNTNRTLTLPDNTGTLLSSASTFAATGPAFSAYKSSAQTPTANTFTKVLFETEEWDTNSNFASSRFTPTVAGYYQINSTVNYNLNSNTCLISIYKNGSEYRRGIQVSISSNGSSATSVSGSVYLNGSSDYVEIYIYQQTSATALTTTTGLTYFDGAMVRGA